MSNYLIIKEMAKVVCLKFSENGTLKEVDEVFKIPSLESAREVFQEYYEGLSEEYFVESWNDFVFSVPALHCVFVLRDLD